MYDKKALIYTTAALLATAVVLVTIRVWSIPFEDILTGIVIYALYGLLIISYLLRFALVFVGVFALYRIFQKRYAQPMAA